MIKLFKLHLFIRPFLGPVLFTVGLLLSSCSSDVPELEAENTAFVAGQVTAVSVNQDSITTGIWNSLVVGTSMSFKVCLTDVAIENQPARNGKFQIKTPFVVQTVQTDPSGCLSWDDHVDFNFLDQEGYFPYAVEISGVTPFKGRIEKDLLINPWQENTSKIVVDRNWVGSIDVSDGDIRDLQYQGQTRTKIKNFKVKNLGIKLREKRSYSEEKVDYLIYDFSMNPYLVRKGMKGEDLDIKSDNGKVKIDFALYERSAGNDKYHLIDKSTSEHRYKDNNLNGEMTLKLPGHVKIGSNSSFQARLTITPIEAPFNLGQELVQTYFEELLSNTKISPERVDYFSEDVTEQVALDQNTENDELEQQTGFDIEHDDHFGYIINTVDLSKGQIVSNNYNRNSQKTLQTDITVCLVDPRSEGKRKPISDTSFRTEFIFNNNNISNTEKIRRVNSNGCLSTNVLVKYDLFEAEKFITFKMVLTGLDGNVKNVIKERILAINPWASGSAFGYDLKLEGAPPEINAKNPRINITDIKYSNEGNVLSSFRLNNYLNLSFKKNFQLNFKLNVERFHSFSEETSLTPLTFGKYNAKIHIMSPSKDDVDYNQINLKDFELISSLEKQVSVKANGDIVTGVDFPMAVTDSYLLGYKNLILVEITPSEGNTSLRPITVAAPFFGIGAGASVKTQIVDVNDLNEKDLSRSKTLIFDGSKILDTHETKSPLELFREKFTTNENGEKLKEIAKIYDGEEDLNKESLIGGRWLSFLSSSELKEKKESWYPDVSFEEIRLISTLPGKIEAKILKKFCRHFYSIPTKERGRVLGVETESNNGESFLNCIQNPRDYLTSVPLTHIQKIIPTRIRREGKVIRKEYAQLVSQDKGKVYRGDAFFAAQGNRYSQYWGHGTRSTTFGGVEVSPKIPLFFGMRAGHSIEYSTYKTTENSTMMMDYDRSFTQRTKMNLDYDSLTLRFKAKVRYCSAITSLKAVNKKLHVCQKEDQYKNSLTETWFFIGRTDMRSNGVLADANKAAADYEHQVIRGKDNYNAIWSKYKKEDVIMVIEQIGTADLSSSFKDVLRDRPYDTPNESRSDNSFPGLMIPVTQ